MPFALLLFLNLMMIFNMDLLEKYRGKNRIILVFTPDYQDHKFQRQQTIFQDNKNKFKERDVIIIEMNQNDGYGEKQLSEEEVLHLRKRFSVNNSEYAVILLGKDGMEKSRYNEVVQAEQLFSLIDSMPMRREEMKNRR